MGNPLSIKITKTGSKCNIMYDNSQSKRRYLNLFCLYTAVHSIVAVHLDLC